ncbi:hypothetical protein [Endozoicomonas sp. SCSIO W0465]|uniref:hypothetical protein n=1 Tax=Endozoicomonas sp. SCSIO W0465 TaxID=2918516 RepID=UPI002074C405|nr:hypothetical protein [Endozoicomonas sp. SCSIO W0465]USE35948.1 hypothetical protein MJO57_28455 [Endozoicomonas sp. SCSIO W0465]
MLLSGLSAQRYEAGAIVKHFCRSDVAVDPSLSVNTLINSSPDGGRKRPPEPPDHSFIRAAAASEYVSGYVQESRKKSTDQILLGNRKVDTAIRSLSEKLGVIPVIRVGLAEAPGQGDHTAAFSIIGGLAHLGFKGRVELVLKAGDGNKWEQMKEKLQLFIPEFNPGNDDVQALRYAGLECECIPLKHLDDHCKINHRPLEQPLGFWAMNGNRSWLQSKIAIVIPPFKWANTIPRIERNVGEHQNLELPSLANYQVLYTPEKPDLSELMQGDSRGARLAKVLGETEEGRIHLLPVYGIHHHALEPAHDVIIRRLISGAMKSHTSEFEKTVVLILSPLESLERLQGLQASLKVPFYDLNTTDWLGSANEPVELLYCGPVPKPLFEWISCVDRPLIQEGANSATFMNLLGKAYLPLRPDGDTPLPELPGSPPAKKKFTLAMHGPVANTERSRIEQLGRSLTHDLQAYSYYSVALELCKKLRPLLSPIATKDLVSRFAGMVAVNHFDEADFRPWLLESITYSCGLLSAEQQEWLTYLSLANSLLPGTIPGALKVKLIEDGKGLRRNSVNLEKLIAYRTSGLNMPNLRLQLSALSFRRFEVLKAASVECPVNIENIAHDMDINELAGDICDNFSRLVPALFQALRKDLPDNALRESFFGDGEGQHSLLDKMIGHLFYGNTAPDTEIRSLLAPQENTIDDDLALFLRGGLGGAFFKQVGELMMESKNNAIYCSLSKLTISDWNQILPG